MEAGVTDTPDRRRSGRRSRMEEHGIVRARVLPGHDVSLIDVSAGGALIESSRRLMPDACVELHLLQHTADAKVVRGRVLRCCVSTLSASTVSYRGAIAFDRPLSWWTDDEAAGRPISRVESRVLGPRRTDAARERPGA